MSALSSIPWGLTSAACVSLATAGIYVLWDKLCQRPPYWLQQLNLLGQQRKQAFSGTVVVCGGSIAGIVTARVCADHFERVILVDPEVGDLEKPKTRVMQYKSAHIFLALFVQGARRLWQDFDNEVEAGGGRKVVADLQVHYSGIPLLSAFRDSTIAASRATIQRVMQKLLVQGQTAKSNLSLVAGTVRGVRPCEGMAAIQSVEVRKRDGSSVSLNDVALVVDCTGRTQEGLKWLKPAGFSVPDRLRASYDGNLRYMTITFSISEEHVARLPIPAAQKRASSVFGYIPHDDKTSSMLGVFIPGKETIQLVCGDTAGNELPRRVEDIIPFVAQFRGYVKPIPGWIIELIRMLCEYGSPEFDVINLTTLSYIRYHSMPAGALPSNFVAVGDASSTLNPIHGQGFAKIMMNGMALNSLLHEVTALSVDSECCLPPSFAARYFKDSSRVEENLWNGTRLNDYGLTACKPMDGESKQKGALVRWMGKKLLSAATKYDDVALAVWRVRHMLAAERALLAPGVLWKILWTRSMFPVDSSR